MTDTKHRPERRSLFGNTARPARSDSETVAPTQKLTEEEKATRPGRLPETSPMQRVDYWTDPARRDADAAKRAAYAATTSDNTSAQAEFSRILATRDVPPTTWAQAEFLRNLAPIENKLFAKRKNRPEKIKALNQAKAFNKIALTIQEVFQDTQLDEAQRRQLLTRIFTAFTKPQIILPETAPERYVDRSDRSENAVDFIQRVYRPWLGTGLTQANIGQLDKQLYMALHNWLRHNDMPADFDLPKKSDVVTRQIASADPAIIRNARRLETAARRRKMP